MEKIRFESLQTIFELFFKKKKKKVQKEKVLAWRDHPVKAAVMLRFPPREIRPSSLAMM